jgi:hypothetical protein
MKWPWISRRAHERKVERLTMTHRWALGQEYKAGYQSGKAMGRVEAIQAGQEAALQILKIRKGW